MIQWPCTLIPSCEAFEGGFAAGGGVDFAGAAAAGLAPGAGAGAALDCARPTLAKISAATRNAASAWLLRAIRATTPQLPLVFMPCLLRSVFHRVLKVNRAPDFKSR